MVPFISTSHSPLSNPISFFVLLIQAAFTAKDINAFVSMNLHHVEAVLLPQERGGRERGGGQGSHPPYLRCPCRLGWEGTICVEHTRPRRTDCGISRGVAGVLLPHTCMPSPPPPPLLLLGITGQMQGGDQLRGSGTRCRSPFICICTCADCLIRYLLTVLSRPPGPHVHVCVRAQARGIVLICN